MDEQYSWVPPTQDSKGWGKMELTVGPYTYEITGRSRERDELKKIIAAHSLIMTRLVTSYKWVA